MQHKKKKLDENNKIVTLQVSDFWQYTLKINIFMCGT
jgi:hypothetical protein